MIAAIVCVDKNWGIGHKNDLLIKIPEDMKFFKEKTLHNIVVMGRKTYDSLGNNPLPKRINCVVTSKTDSVDYNIDGNYYLMSMGYVKENLLQTFSRHDYIDVFIIGGGSVYKELLPYCDTVYVTKVDYAFENVDTYFQNLENLPEWEVESTSKVNEYNSLKYKFFTYKKEVWIMIVLVGESASGKSSIEKYLVDNYGYSKVISYTTRSPRPNEVDGIDYHFVSVEQFLALKEQGFFAETAIYNNWHYGTAKEDCTDDKIAVLTPHGLRQISKVDGITAISFYISVSRRDRLIKILQRGDDIEEAYRRSLSDVGQFDGIEDEVDYVINNDGYIKSIEEMSKEVMKEIDFLEVIYY